MDKPVLRKWQRKWEGREESKHGRTFQDKRMCLVPLKTTIFKELHKCGGWVQPGGHLSGQRSYSQWMAGVRIAIPRSETGKIPKSGVGRQESIRADVTSEENKMQEGMRSKQGH